MSIVAFGSPTGLRYLFLLVFGEMHTIWAMYKCAYPYLLILVLKPEYVYPYAAVRCIPRPEAGIYAQPETKHVDQG